jgi:hypothetical protein
MAKADPAAHQLPARIGAAARLAAHHRGNGAGVSDAGAKTDFAGYPAHGAPDVSLLKKSCMIPEF